MHLNRYQYGRLTVLHRFVCRIQQPLRRQRTLRGMSVQSRWFTIPIIVLMMTSCNTPNTVEFLGFEGCPNTPELRKRLLEASPSTTIINVDLMTLEVGDPRLGWGAPTILVNGEDLFGVPANKGGSVSCRNWSKGLPSVKDIRQTMENKTK